ncbi:MAG: glutathione S-transferase family protein [Anderseniella sp.]|jgi:glutathione S-transferase|nr:glutathione S-transferase family protein [Anderseniella sp.]
MVRLLHFPLDPFSRRVRLTLSEMGIAAELLEERPWEAREDFISLNPAGTLPVLIDEDGTVCAGVEATGCHLDETRSTAAGSLWGTGPAQRAEVRRLVAWFDGKFHHEVTSPLLMEKVVKRFVPEAQGGGAPNMNRVRAALAALKDHLAYIDYLTSQHNLLAGNDITVADLAAACHLSVADYTGDIVWDAVPDAKAWYQRIKSRPSFRPLLADHVRGLTPSASYAELDF